MFKPVDIFAKLNIRIDNIECLDITIGSHNKHFKSYSSKQVPQMSPLIALGQHKFKELPASL